MKSIRLHPTLGLNPKLGVCPICKEANGEVLLPGAAVKEEYPRHMYGGLCDKCKNILKENVGFINKTNGDSAVIKYEAVVRMFGEEGAKQMKCKVVIVEDTFWGEEK